MLVRVRATPCSDCARIPNANCTNDSVEEKVGDRKTTHHHRFSIALFLPLLVTPARTKMPRLPRRLLRAFFKFKLPSEAAHSRSVDIKRSFAIEPDESALNPAVHAERASSCTSSITQSAPRKRAHAPDAPVALQLASSESRASTVRQAPSLLALARPRIFRSRIGRAIDRACVPVP